MPAMTDAARIAASSAKTAASRSSPGVSAKTKGDLQRSSSAR